MDNNFGDRVSLLERSGAHNFRYRIRRDTTPKAPDHNFTSANWALTLSGDEEEGKLYEEEMVTSLSNSSNDLSEIFAKIEYHKTFLRIEEYSVGQTTLEQIFN